MVSLLFGIPLGLYQAVKRYTVGDYVLTGVSFLGYATPTFFVGLLLIEWFAINIHLFPPFAPQGTTVAQILSQPRALVLPVAAYSFVLYALWSRYMRSSVMDNLVQDYVRTARAKGASERRVLWGHIFRNSLISIVTLLGLSLPTLVAGAIFIEVVFNYPGMGLAFYNAALNVDYQVLLGFTLRGHAGDDRREHTGRRGVRRPRPESEVQLMAIIPPGDRSHVDTAALPAETPADPRRGAGGARSRAACCAVAGRCSRRTGSRWPASASSSSSCCSASSGR